MVLLYDWGREISPYAAAPVLMAADRGTVRAKEVNSKRFMNCQRCGRWYGGQHIRFVHM